MIVRQFASIFFSLMIIISSSGVLQSKHRLGNIEQMRAGHAVPMTSPEPMARSTQTSAKHGNIGQHQKRKNSSQHMSSNTRKHDGGQMMKSCCALATLLTSCSLMPLCVEEDSLWAKEIIGHNLAKFSLTDKFLPSLVHPPPRSPPRLS